MNPASPYPTVRTATDGTPCPCAVRNSSGARPAVIVASRRVRPSPTLLVTRFASSAPASEPNAPIPSTRPSCAALSPIVRTAYTTKTVSIAFCARLNVADWVSRLRSTGLPYTARRPSAIRLRTVVCSAGLSGSGSRTFIRLSITTENRYEPAFTVSVTGAVRIPTRKPPSPGPAIIASEKEVWSRPLASVSCSRSTTLGTNDSEPTSKMTVRVPIATATAHSSQIDRKPPTAASGTRPMNTARPRFVAISTGQRRRRSSQIPANRDTTTIGRYRIALTTPTSSAEARRLSTATSGSAKRITSEPTSEIVSPIQNLRNSGLRSAPGVFTTSDMHSSGCGWIGRWSRVERGDAGQAVVGQEREVRVRAGRVGQRPVQTGRGAAVEDAGHAVGQRDGHRPGHRGLLPVADQIQLVRAGPLGPVGTPDPQVHHEDHPVPVLPAHRVPAQQVGRQRVDRHGVAGTQHLEHLRPGRPPAGQPQG